jgi:hypothetical protein
LRRVHIEDILSQSDRHGEASSKRHVTLTSCTIAREVIKTEVFGNIRVGFHLGTIKVSFSKKSTGEKPIAVHTNAVISQGAA